MDRIVYVFDEEAHTTRCHDERCLLVVKQAIAHQVPNTYCPGAAPPETIPAMQIYIHPSQAL